jgi:hypothetical protein
VSLVDYPGGELDRAINWQGSDPLSAELVWLAQNASAVIVFIDPECVSVGGTRWDEDLAAITHAVTMARRGAGREDIPVSVVVTKVDRHNEFVQANGGVKGVLAHRARVLSDVVPQAVAALPEGIRRHLRVAHQAREEYLERVVAAYAAAGIMAEVEPFFRDIPRRLSEAQLVVSRSGASSVADISVIGRPAILIPFAAATGDHQSANARGLVDAGAAVLMPEKLLDPAALAAQLEAVLGQPDAAVAMAQHALGQGKPDATGRLVALVEELAKGKTA